LRLPDFKTKVKQFHYRSGQEFETPRFQDKGKASPLQVWTGPEGARSLRLPDSKTKVKQSHYRSGQEFETLRFQDKGKAIPLQVWTGV